MSFKNHLMTVVTVLLTTTGTAFAQDKWVVGHSSPLSGGNAKFGTDIRAVAMAYYAMLNASGGSIAQVVRSPKKPVNAQSVLEALSGLGTYDLGGFSVSFASNQHHKEPPP